MTPQQRAEDTQLIQLPPAVIDPFPPPRQPTGRRRVHRDGSGGGPRSIVALAAVVMLVVGAFLAGQLSVRRGIVPPPPMPAAAAEVITAAQMARIWPHVTPADVRAQCEPWRKGEWREYVTDRWVTHLHSRVGGGIDVDRATVARFLDRACARGSG